MYKNQCVNKSLLAGDKFMHEMHLKQPGFTYSASGVFTKNKESKYLCPQEIQILNYRNELDKACFQYDIAYSKSKDLAKRIQ